MKKATYAFIDLENIGSLKKVDLSRYKQLYVFCGPKQDSLTLNKIPTCSFQEIKIFKTSEISKNNLDFHICYYLGKFDVLEKDEVSFVVISNDKGYDNVISHIRTNGRDCSRVGCNTTSTVKKESEIDIKIQSVINSLLGKEVKNLPKTEKAFKNHIKSHLGKFNTESNINYTYNRLKNNEVIKNRLSQLKVTT